MIYEDLTGVDMAGVKVISLKYIKRYKITWNVECKCGKTFKARHETLLSSESILCPSCLRMMRKEDDKLIGLKLKSGSEVIERDYSVETSDRYKLKCGDCENFYYSRSSNFLKKENKGFCYLCTRKRIVTNSTNLEGEKFGRWTVLFCSDKRTQNGNILYECVCDCGKMKLISSNQLNMNQSKSCGCLQKEIVSKLFKGITGKNHRCWKGGKAKWKKSTVVIKRGQKAQNLRIYIYKRDNYKCVLCSSNKKLNAHHLNGQNWYKEGVYEETNIATLCLVCHYDFHKKYGRGNNTVEQFIEYCKLNNVETDNLFQYYSDYKQKNNFTYKNKDVI